MYKNGIILTGPIGSGKSEALSIVSRLGYKTVDLDIISNNILNSEDSIDFLKTNFLDCLENDKVVRAKLANIVFQDKEKLQLLEAYLHPKVQSQLVDILSSSDQLTFIEVSAPKNVIDMFKTIVLWSPEKVRIERLINRGKTSGRIDDQNETMIRNRFVEYNNKTALLKSFYTAQGKFHSVSGIGGVEEITQRLIELIDGLI